MEDVFITPETENNWPCEVRRVKEPDGRHRVEYTVLRPLYSGRATGELIKRETQPLLMGDLDMTDTLWPMFMYWMVAMDQTDVGITVAAHNFIETLGEPI